MIGKGNDMKRYAVVVKKKGPDGRFHAVSTKRFDNKDRAEAQADYLEKLYENDFDYLVDLYDRGRFMDHNF